MAHRHAPENAVSHASTPANFGPARFVLTTVGGPSQVVEMGGSIADGLTRLTRPTDAATAHAQLAGFNRADDACRFCNGDRTGSATCHDCGMVQ